jgi:hypothetical protein
MAACQEMSLSLLLRCPELQNGGQVLEVDPEPGHVVHPLRRQLSTLPALPAAGDGSAVDGGDAPACDGDGLGWWCPRDHAGMDSDVERGHGLW